MLVCPTILQVVGQARIVEFLHNKFGWEIIEKLLRVLFPSLYDHGLWMHGDPRPRVSALGCQRKNGGDRKQTQWRSPFFQALTQNSLNRKSSFQSSTACSHSLSVRPTTRNRPHASPTYEHDSYDNGVQLSLVLFGPCRRHSHVEATLAQRWKLTIIWFSL